uniref:Stress-induced-phosphoprotein 1 n=1 Tax=Parastrongyloides trichosuri TaxID=131310 RepID=A0A0N4Z4A1_PARTI
MDKEKAEEAKALGNAAYLKKDFETALRHYDEAIALDGTNMAFYTNKAAVFFEQKDYEKCIEICKEAVDIGRENRAEYKLLAKAMARCGNAYWKQNNLKEALVWIEKSLSEHRDPELVKKQKTLKKEIEDAERKAYINPELAEEEKAKGNDLFKKGDYPGAVKCYSEAIKRNPEVAVYYSNRAACFLKLMEFKRAIDDCDNASKIDPKNVKAYVRKGAAYFAMKNMSSARKAYNDALLIDPNNAEAKEGLNKCFSTAPPTDPEEVRKRAMADPEIQDILSDPAMQMILEQMSKDPNAAKEHMQSPEIMSKIMKLIEAGVVGTR